MFPGACGITAVTEISDNPISMLKLFTSSALARNDYPDKTRADQASQNNSVVDITQWTEKVSIDLNRKVTFSLFDCRGLMGWGIINCSIVISLGGKECLVCMISVQRNGGD